MKASAGGSVTEPPSQEPPSRVEDQTVWTRPPHVLWLTPDKPDNISVGRNRIAERLDADGIEVTVRGTTPSTILASFREREQYDAIVGTTRSGAMAGAFLSVLTGTPLVVDHVDPIRQLEETHPPWLVVAVRWVENLAFWLSERVLFVYEEEESRVNRFADASSPTELGVDYEQIANPSPAAVEAARDRIGDDDLEDNVAIYVGGLEPIYHVESLLDSVDHLEDWSLLVLGTGSLADDVERAAASNDAIVFPGSVPHEEMPGFLHLADVGVCLVDDPRTLKVLEYGAAGLPTVHLRGRSQSRFGGLVEYCDTSPESIARAVQRAHERDGEALGEFVRAYDWGDIGAQYRRAILSTVSRINA
ncbi:glycosyltransferase [Halobacteria archaeon HArc-gm2]|nr:glycosyltransferase [Halobacteria archaeon HArc-gm2]